MIKKLVAIDDRKLHDKKLVFNFLLFLVVILVIILLEVGLRIFNYGGKQSLFISMDGDLSDYKRCNPNVSKRYFRSLETYPTPPKDIFLKKKPYNGYRIFIVGESTAAGFPYGGNLTFSRILEKRLSDTFPDKYIEVVNTAMSAVNTYTVFDLIDEILDEKPDAILIYLGHNEYYGALGIGSVESLGKFPAMTKVYLKLTHYKIVQVLRDAIGYFQRIIRNNQKNDKSNDAFNTLMARIVKNKKIPYKSQVYQLGLHQFEDNLDVIIRKIQKKKVDIIISELISNVRDIEPFESVESDTFPRASEVYLLAKRLESENKYDQAMKAYYFAKDLDALRFRAPEDINDIIHSIAEKYNIPVVRLKECFIQNSQHKIIGDDLMTDHLHPNITGYFLMADAYYNEMMNNRFIAADWDQKNTNRQYRYNWGYTELDSVYAELTIKQLKSGWPFQVEGTINTFLLTYHPQNPIEDIAYEYLKNQKYGIEVAHLQLARLYKKQGQFEKALAEYRALSYIIPSEVMFYTEAAQILLEMKDFDRAQQILLKSLKYQENFFANKWCGQIYLRNNDYPKAIIYLEKAQNMKKDDTQLLFNLARAYFNNGNPSEAQKYYKQLLKIAPKSNYIKYLNNMFSLQKNYN